MVRICLVLTLVACAQDDLDLERQAPALDRPFFRCRVQPVLAARCAFPACHGTNLRPFRVFARQRLRLEIPPDRREAELTAEEETANFGRALAFVGDEKTPPLLLAKPLEAAAGGFYHRAKTLYADMDVFATADDPGYRQLADWVAGGIEDPGCVSTEDVGP